VPANEAWEVIEREGRELIQKLVASERKVKEVHKQLNETAVKLVDFEKEAREADVSIWQVYQIV